MRNKKGYKQEKNKDRKQRPINQVLLGLSFVLTVIFIINLTVYGIVTPYVIIGTYLTVISLTYSIIALTLGLHEINKNLKYLTRVYLLSGISTTICCVSLLIMRVLGTPYLGLEGVYFTVVLLLSLLIFITSVQKKVKG